MRSLLRAVVAISMLACALHGLAQKQGRTDWQPASNTASSITGDITVSDAKLTIDFISYPIASIRSLKPAEVSAVFDADVNTAGFGTLYRLRVPAAQRFLHKNTLCGTQDTEWMAAYIAGKSLEVAFFSGEDEPVFTIDAIAQSPNLCGTYSYVR